MHTTLEFPELLRLIDERSTTFRAVIAAAPDLGAPVPSCPGWSLLDLARHIGERRRSWALTVAAGPAATGRIDPEPSMPQNREDLPAWLADGTRQMLDALRAAGPESPCWVWWKGSQSPPTTGAVARHQLHEIAVHTYDAQLAVGDPRPLPEAVALDGIEEFNSTCAATGVPWPYEPSTIDYHTDEGRSWRVTLDGEGVRVARLSGPDGAASVSTRSTAGDLMLVFYGRLPLDAVTVEGDRGVIDQIAGWDPTA